MLDFQILLFNIFEFNGVSSQSHVSHCRVLPLGEFTVTIPEPHATLQGAVTWRNQCRDRDTLQGVRIPSAILKIVFAIFYFLFLMQFRLWRAAAFVSSLIHLLIKKMKPSEIQMKSYYMWQSSSALPSGFEPSLDHGLQSSHVNLSKIFLQPV